MWKLKDVLNGIDWEVHIEYRIMDPWVDENHTLHPDDMLVGYSRWTGKKLVSEDGDSYDLDDDVAKIKWLASDDLVVTIPRYPISAGAFQYYDGDGGLRRDRLFNDLLKVSDRITQTDIAMEEMSELTKAIVKYRRATKNPISKELATQFLDHIAEEIADVRITTDQLVQFYDLTERTAAWEHLKLERLANTIRIKMEEEHGASQLARG